MGAGQKQRASLVPVSVFLHSRCLWSSELIPPGCCAPFIAKQQWQQWFHWVPNLVGLLFTTKGEGAFCFLQQCWECLWNTLQFLMCFLKTYLIFRAISGDKELILSLSVNEETKAWRHETTCPSSCSYYGKNESQRSQILFPFLHNKSPETFSHQGLTFVVSVCLRSQQ